MSSLNSKEIRWLEATEWGNEYMRKEVEPDLVVIVAPRRYLSCLEFAFEKRS